MPWHAGAARPDQEVKVSALISLQNMLGVQPGVAPVGRVLGRDPPGLPAGEFLVAHFERERPAWRVELDPVAAADECQRAAHGGLGRDMQDNGAETGAAHPGIGDADHVGDPAFQQLAREDEIPDLRHPRVALRARPADDQHGGRVDPKVVPPSHLVVFLDRVEYQGLAAVLEQMRRRG